MLTRARHFAMIVAGTALLSGCAENGAPRNPGDEARTPKRCPAFDTGRWMTLRDPALDDRRIFRERRAMAKSLVRCRSLDGLSRTAVRRLLGPPSRSGPDYVEYLLGAEDGVFGVDEVFLFIDIEQGRVTRYEVAAG